MRIGKALGKLFDGMTIMVNAVTVDIQNNYGNQDLLDKFIADSNRKKAQKFPLLFYVVRPTKKFGNYRYCDTDLIIFMKTSEPLLAKDRTDKVYEVYIEPIYEAVVKLLRQSIALTDLSEKIDRYQFDDVPNYGIRNEESNKSNKPVSAIQNRSAVTDYVDARVIKLRLKINTSCLIT
ncbi:MAG: hypothetical protein ACUZ8H_01430 [Candidatus Anammoxibacter sp.]